MGLVGFDFGKGDLCVAKVKGLAAVGTALAAGRATWDPADVWNYRVRLPGAVSVRKQAGSCPWLPDLVRRDGDGTWVVSPPSLLLCDSTEGCGWMLQHQHSHSPSGALLPRRLQLL